MIDNRSKSMPEEGYLTELRREFHQYPEPGWREFWTTARIVEELERIGADEIHVGPAAVDSDERLGVPDDEELAHWFDKAKSKTDRTDVLEQIEGGSTGVVAVVDRGDGPSVGLRADIDALPVRESSDDEHVPASEGFRSNNEGFMHACGHDSHITFGLGTLNIVVESDFNGTFTVFFQPSEELLGGGKAMAAGPHIDDIDYLIGAHVGLDNPTGTVVAGLDGALALSRWDVAFEGESAHAGLEPNNGRNAVQALVAAVDNIYGIPRHEEGATRVNVGNVRSDNLTNVIADHATAQVEVRGETTELMEYMCEAVYRCLDSAAEMYKCTVDTSIIGESIRRDCDEELVDLVGSVGDDIGEVSSVVRRDDLGASEDVTYLMKKVQENGGQATFIGIGASNPTGHHTPTFDIDEDSLPIGVSVLSKTALELLS
jgi:aminobenzoyl-glutamate utilization protein A